MAKDRSPNWAKWKHIPDVMLWQAVALSLNIDPDRADCYPRWTVESWVTGEPKKFKDRLDILMANFGPRRTLKPTRISLSASAESSLQLDTFAAWAISIGWSIPTELTGLSARVPRRKLGVSEPDRWAATQLWTLLQAAYLLCNEDPPTAVKGTIKDIATPLTDDDIQLEQLVGGSEQIYDALKDATDLRHLDFVETRTGAIGNRRVEPAKCVTWAIARGMHVPESFRNLAITAASSAKRESLHPKERDSLLKLVITMAIKGYKHDPRAQRSDAIKRIVDDAAECGLSIDADTVRKWVDKAAELVALEDIQRTLATDNPPR